MLKSNPSGGRPMKLGRYCGNGKVFIGYCEHCGNRQLLEFNRLQVLVERTSGTGAENMAKFIKKVIPNKVLMHLMELAD